MNIAAYVTNIASVFATGSATEHSYRPALQSLFASIAPDLAVINEPARIACGAPDFVLQRRHIPVGHVEAKDLPVNLAKLSDSNKEQQQRYRKALPNLIYTNGIDFVFFKDGESTGTVSVATFAGGKVKPIPANFEVLSARLRDFATQTPITITSAQKLAEMMAGKAALIKDIMGKALDRSVEGELHNQFKAFQDFLIADITPADFADVYAETIAYGLFAARLHDDTPQTFSRSEALDLLPKTNPFLRNLFTYVAGPNLDDRIAWVVDELCEIFRATDLHALLKDFGKFTAQTDPFIHFYEHSWGPIILPSARRAASGTRRNRS